ncbi:DUF6339 family protein [Streptomyces sp. NPDC091272]|uniref:DUF6339 family protein n=1 Tax=Streptomyces sp. NPDC091272 TaxID=3365981 RepID=UPI0037F476DC
MTAKPDPMPHRLALLSDANAAKNLSTGVLSGKEDPPLIALGKASEPFPVDSARLLVDPLRALIDDAMYVHRDDTPTKADAWLAPRLHAVLRLTRREAADARLWNFIALSVAPDYVVWRHLPGKGKNGSPPTVAADRFRGAHYTQAFSRLWWAAELFRDGADYKPVQVACGNQDVLNTVLRLDIIDHRPTAQALVRLVERGTARTGREVNALATVANSAASTLMYDVIAADHVWDGGALEEWIGEGEAAPHVSSRTLPDGPDDGPVPEDSVKTLVDHFEELFMDARVRGKVKGGAED